MKPFYAAAISILIGLACIGRIHAATGSATTGNITVDTRSSNADLGALTLAGVTFSPPFNTETFTYGATVEHAKTTVILRPTVAESHATVSVQVNGGSFANVVSGTDSSPLALVVGDNTIEVRVTAQNTTTQRSYVLTINREAAAPTVVSPSATSITATGASLGGNVSDDGGAAITERGIVYAPTTVNPDPLIDGPGVIKVVVPGTTGVYSTTVTGLGNAVAHSFKAYAVNSKGTSYSPPSGFIPLGNNPALGSLDSGSTTLSPAFSPETTTYHAEVANAIDTFPITPLISEAGAIVKINGSVNVSGTSRSIALNVGSNTITIEVTAQNGTDKRTYTITVVRLGPPTLTGTDLISYSGVGATLRATVSESSSGAVTARGFVFGTASLPEVGTATTVEASTAGLGLFQVSTTGLSPGVRYFARPYAENQDGIGYGTEVSFHTDTPVAFPSGNPYQLNDRTIRPGEIQRFSMTLDSARDLSLTLTDAGPGLVIRIRDSLGTLLQSSTIGNLDRDVLAGDYTVEVQNTTVAETSFSLNVDASTTITVTPVVSFGPPTLTSKKLKAVTSSATIRNDGELADVLQLRSGKSTRDFVVSYSSGGNITAAITAGTFETAETQSGAGSTIVKVSVTPNKKTLLKKGKVLKRTLAIQTTATSKTLPANSASGVLRVMTR